MREDYQFYLILILVPPFSLYEVIFKPLEKDKQHWAVKIPSDNEIQDLKHKIIKILHIIFSKTN